MQTLQKTNTFRNIVFFFRLPDMTSRNPETQIRLKNVWCKALNNDSSYFFVVSSVLLGSTSPGLSPFPSLMDSVLPSSESLSGTSEDKR